MTRSDAFEPAQGVWLRAVVVLVILGLLGAVLGAVLALTRPQRYTARAYVAVVAQKGTDSTVAQQFTSAYARIANDPVILTRAAALLDPPTEPSVLESAVDAGASPDAPLLEITAKDVAAQRAAAMADIVAATLVGYANRRVGQTSVRLVVFATAERPNAPSSPSQVQLALLGAFVGLLIGALVVLQGVRDRLPMPG